MEAPAAYLSMFPRRSTEKRVEDGPVTGGEAAAAGICAEQEPTVKAQGSQEGSLGPWRRGEREAERPSQPVFSPGLHPGSGHQSREGDRQ